MRLGLLVIQSIIGEKALALNDDLVYHLLPLQRVRGVVQP